MNLSITPRAAWLSKLTQSFGRSRWQQRFFVLLDTELRYYKSEHAVTPSNTLNLRHVGKVVINPSPNHPFTFRLEPHPELGTTPVTPDADKAVKPWTIECQSLFELEAWMDAIQFRLSKLTETPKRRSPLLPSYLSRSSASSVNTPAVSPMTVAGQSSVSRPRRLNKSLSRRRGVILSPITVPFLEATSSSEPSSDSPTSCHSVMSLASVNLYQANHTHPSKPSTSPTFQLYKDRFQL
ncbi:uncharacterized protein BYT42DRAFT_562516 [Radiomyces spectabilis]|uniref:uncharacterized protein n=1 Tax=Radiomyces spectabilis TaxID=64574 RepID=UPI00221E55D4|nr:uncharacterized protein BYT42DRAFT_562516 [Radiomyces spectabilis]KAI8384427.1 hypothetical protein BYT42DRAFT_562516 [Radiomyces spectabilis]